MGNMIFDGFDHVSLTNAVNAAPVSLGPVTKSGLFDDRPTTTTEIALEMVNEQLTLVKASLRGGPVMPHPKTDRGVIKFKATHLKANDTMLADSWQGRSGFGQNGTPANVLTERNRILAEHRRRIEATIDFHKTRALSGQILDADGSVLIDLLTEFGVAQELVPCALDQSTTNAANKIVAARRISEAQLGLATPTGWVAFADAQFMDALRAHPSVEAALASWQAATAMLADHRHGDLVVGGVRFVEVPNRAGQIYIPAGSAFLCPEGVPDLFVSHYAPADYIESVNQEGLPIYSKSEELDLGKGVEIESQSNPVSVVSRPRAVVKLTA